jgi:hypothetical protein
MANSVSNLIVKMSSWVIPQVTIQSVLDNQWFQVANTLFPVQESINLAVVIAAYSVLCATIRIIKSFIPTIA